MDATAAAVLDFWFGPGPPVWRKMWFLKDPDFDASCARFAPLRAAALAGAHDAWAETPRGVLALLILLDQLSRNLFRGQAAAFAADPRARALAGAALERGFDRALTPIERVFLYLPVMHSEALADQDLSVTLCEALPPIEGASVAEQARRHRDVIRRFGRYPHRNAALGRASTPDELAYLAEPGAGF